MKTINFIATITVIAPLVCLGQTPDDFNAGMRIEHDESTGANTVSWWGIEDHAYFILTSQDLINWLYINEIFVGEDAVENSFNFILSGGGDKAFFKLQFTDDPIDPKVVGAFDLDGDGISNQAELDNGTDPFSALDLSGNGIPDDADYLWANVSTTWKELIVNSSNAYIYDPDGSITTANDVSPIDDYDGDGLSNLQEYLNGTPANDYYNNDTPQVYIVAGNYQKSEPDTFSSLPLVVLVLSSSEEKLENAPVVFSVSSGGGLVALDEQGAGIANQVVVRTFSSSRNPRVFYKQPSQTGLAGTIEATAGDTSVTFDFQSISQVSSNPPPAAENFTSTLNPDGSATMTWDDVSTNEHFFTLYLEDKMGKSWAAGVAPQDAESFTVPAAVANNLP